MNLFLPGDTESPFMANEVITGTLTFDPGTIHVPAWQEEADGEDIVREEVEVAGEGEHEEVEDIAICEIFWKTDFFF